MFKPKKKIKTIRKVYWDCGIEEHSHGTERIAYFCMEKRARAKAFVSRKNIWTKAALLSLLAANKAGEKQCVLARKYGVSPSRMGQLINQAERVWQKDNYVQSNKG